MRKKLNKLTFMKETVRSMTHAEMAEVAGGSCWTSNPRSGPSGGVITTIGPTGSQTTSGGGCGETLVP